MNVPLQIRRTCLKWLVQLVCVGLAAIVGWVNMPPATASILYTADTSGAIVAQSRRTLRDSQRQSWQVIAFKRVQPNRADTATYLRVVGFPGQANLAHPQSVALVDWQQRWELADRSDQSIGPQPNVGEYELQPILEQLPHQRLRLELVSANQVKSLRIAPVLVEEWKQIDSTTAVQLTNACELFPLEARQNPAFPEWTSCRIE